MSLIQGRLQRDGLVRSTLLAVAVRITSPASMLVVIAILAHLRTPSVLGEYTFLILLVQLAELLKCLGLNALVTREAAKTPVEALLWWRSLVRIGNVGTVLAAPVLFVVVMISARGTPTWVTILTCFALLPGLWASSYSVANEAIFFGVNRVPFLAVVVLIECLTRASLSIAMLYILHISVTGLAVIYSLSRVLSALAGGLLRRKLRLPEVPYDRSHTLALVRESVPFLTVFVFPLLLFRADVIALGLAGDATEVGTYSAASRLFTLALLLPDSAMTTLFAGYSHAITVGRSYFESLVLRSCAVVVSIASLIAVASYLLSHFIIELLFGPQFDRSSSLFRLLIWALPLFAFSRTLGDALVAMSRQSVTAYLVVSTTIASVVLYALFVPTLHGLGAALGFLSSACVLALFSGVMFSRLERISWHKLAFPLIPTAAAIVTLTSLVNDFARFIVLSCGAALSVWFILHISARARIRVGNSEPRLEGVCNGRLNSDSNLQPIRIAAADYRAASSSGDLGDI